MSPLGEDLLARETRRLRPADADPLRLGFGH
jgi:hypothetical protein